LRRGESRPAFFQRILDALALIGGETEGSVAAGGA